MTDDEEILSLEAVDTGITSTTQHGAVVNLGFIFTSDEDPPVTPGT